MVVEGDGHGGSKNHKKTALPSGSAPSSPRRRSTSALPVQMIVHLAYLEASPNPSLLHPINLLPTMAPVASPVNQYLREQLLGMRLHRFSITFPRLHHVDAPAPPHTIA